MKRVAIYLRVSTSKQDTENQLRELTAVADRSGLGDLENLRRRWDQWRQGPGQTSWARRLANRCRILPKVVVC
jgi:DNA invertase Pin-like site-specific DNA recombinase